MENNFVDKIIEELIDREGGYVNSPIDRGGETCFGITKKVAVEYGYLGNMKKLPKKLAKSIYLDQYLIKPGIHRVLVISKELGEYLFDYAVHSGPRQASLDFQICLNLFNNQERIWKDIKIDGIIGSNTINTLKKAINYRGTTINKVLVEAVDDRRGILLQELAKRSEEQETHLFGWYVRKIEVKE